MKKALIAASMLSILAPVSGDAALFRRASSAGGRSSSIALRDRLHANPLITEPGTMEFDFAGAISRSGSFSLPSTVRITPEGRHIWWGRTEFSIGFDALSSVVQGNERATHFSDRVTVAANCVLSDGARFDFAFAPQVSILLRGDAGYRVGGTAIGRYDWGLNSFGVTASWTGATATSATNPAGIFDLGTGYVRRLTTRGALAHLTAHTNLVYERASGIQRQLSIFEGIEYQINDKIAVDVAGQHYSVWGGPVDHQVVVSITVSTSKLGRSH